MHNAFSLSGIVLKCFFMGVSWLLCVILWSAWINHKKVIFFHYIISKLIPLRVIIEIPGTHLRVGRTQIIYLTI